MTTPLHRLEGVVVDVLGVPRSFLRFALVGATGVVVNQAVLLTAVALGAVVPVASVIASELAVINNYTLNELWSFGRGRLSIRRLAMFNATALVGIAITAAVLTLLDSTTSLPLVVANLVAVAAATGWNYAVSAAWTFRRRVPDEAVPAPEAPHVTR